MELRAEFQFSPPVITSLLRTVSGAEIVVARDDYLTGGTKERALWGYLGNLSKREYIYASPFSGYAQIALAHVSAQMGRSCVIIAETDPKTGQLHEYSRRARAHGASVFPARNLAEAEEISERLALSRPRMIKIPLGFDVPEFRESMAQVLSKEWVRIHQSVPGGVRRLWLPVGSGTLASSFLSFLPKEIVIKALNVRVLSSADQRIQRVKGLIDLREARMPFHDSAELLPSIPSNLYYDAKLWEHINEEGLSGDVWWNVAG